MARSDDRSWTWMLIRGANRPAIQYRLPKTIVMLVTFVIILIFLTLLISFVIQRVTIHHALTQVEQLESNLTQKERQLAEMNRQLAVITEASAQMKIRMDKVSQWERQLRSYLHVSSKADTPVAQKPPAPLSGERPFAQLPGLIPVGGEFIESALPPQRVSFTEQTKSLVDAHPALSMWHESRRQLEQMERTWNEWETEIPLLLEQADSFKKKLDATPTLWPTNSTRITSAFGDRDDPFHRSNAFHSGLDIAGNTGDSVYAAAVGEVIASDVDALKGNYIIIKHHNGLSTRYLHMSKRLAKAGDKVAKGQIIGEVGSTGRSTGPHLHFEIRQGDEAIDPEGYISPP
ncbi:M23 family metallopeptidase [Paenibacillus apiarius]|uniref:M23 family metallopeptidase n=1 Tax=Paenibacillus apiarius TaxID=46240 RepID=A0ABT4DYT5_9BACL|nr:M23 family metallopeptidase [Paenibacillus apiarius]MCY9516513.1 M23 family metallopeptidase [Paenibacillus apiarius]MCY9522504.1 M23 family metallopeptidase [Paenibacillus apiarius]MCY9554572.1 M23 family metallopeptidase [Paenibacillus apiarius]MCY9556688.1 M23 family metallopeptidase [Paenibacillus apiarius]MCY9686631.1 M23 family metallopeptidase [Paenibacillus apiarius]